MKEYKVNKKINKKFFPELITFVGKEVTREFTKDKSMKSRQSFFEFGDDYVEMQENKIEDFLSQIEWKYGEYKLWFFIGNKSFQFRVKYNEPDEEHHVGENDKAEYRISSRAEDQVWAEGIVEKFYKIVNEYTSKNKEIELPNEPITKDDVEHVIKNHLQQNQKLKKNCGLQEWLLEQ